MRQAVARAQLIILASLGSAALLMGAFAFQAFGYAPCHLCLLQRWPHAAAVAIGAVALALGWRQLPWLGAAAALTTAGLGLYHTGVERTWWEGPTTCTSGSIAGVDPKALLDQILAAPIVRCDEVAWQLLGLSMASWNMLASLAFALIWIAAARKTA
jgi:disulfide bond formation protein DsbB